jgi:hypothetical protein
MSPEPTYWIFRGSTPEPVLEGPLAAPAGHVAAVPNTRSPLAVEIWNPTSDTLTFDIQWELHARLQSPDRNCSASIHLSPGERQQATIDVQPVGGHRIPFAAALPCLMTYRCDPIKWSGELKVPVTMGAVTLPHGELSKEPVFRLRNIDHVVNLSEHDPHTAHLLWKGREDQSAEVRGARTGDGLELLIDVRDDQHYAISTNDLEDNDHLELFVRVAGHEQVQRVRVADIGDGKLHLEVNGLKEQDAAASGVRVNSWGETPLRHYRITLSDEMLRLSDADPGEGVRLNLRVHDNDGRGQKGWIRVAPGTTREDAAGWPVLLMENGRSFKCNG